MKNEEEKNGEAEVEVLAPPKFFQQVTSAEVDIQVSTAKKYKRSLDRFHKTALSLATLDEETAESCFYVLPRGGRNIEGPSARLAEIVAYSWQNMRADARIVDEDERFVVARGVCWDLETNNTVGYEVRRRVTDSRGKRYNDDMIAMTSNAACSIALRNAVFKIVPKPAWEPIYKEAKKVAVGDSKTLVDRRDQAMAHFAKMGVKPDTIFKKLGVKAVEEITLDHLAILKGLSTAIREGETSVDNAFAEEHAVEAPVRKQPEAESKPEAKKPEPKPRAAKPEPKPEPESEAAPEPQSDPFADVREFITNASDEEFLAKTTQQFVTWLKDKPNGPVKNELTVAFTNRRAKILKLRESAEG